MPVHGFTSRTATEHVDEALIAGNGRQGALCYGGPARVLVTVSHGHLFGSRRATDPFAGAATLTCTPEPAPAARDYTRSTDFSTGVVTQRWNTDAGPAGMAAFVSRAHDVVALRLHGPARWAVTLRPVTGPAQRPTDTVVRRRGDRITLTARSADGSPGHTVVCRLYGPDLVLLRTVPGPADAEAALTGVPPNWTGLLRAHAALHRDLYHRVQLDLGSARRQNSEDLLAAAPGPEMVRRLFDAGRYAVISGVGGSTRCRPDPAAVDDPAARAAAVRTVRRRLALRRADRSGATPGELARLGLAAAGLGLAEEAAGTLSLMAARYWRPNLVPASWPGETVDVDLAGAFPAVVSAMLARATPRVLAAPGGPRSYARRGGAAASGRVPLPGRLDLLSALPAAWSAGSVRGIEAGNAVTVRRLSWTPGRYEAVVESSIDQDLWVRVAGGRAERLSVEAGRPVRRAGAFTNGDIDS